jgi:hypothetical protein
MVRRARARPTPPHAGNIHGKLGSFVLAVDDLQSRTWMQHISPFFS